MAELRRSGELDYLRPDSKTQVQKQIEYFYHKKNILF
jgi:S-adenosylmethionine synthetase